MKSALGCAAGVAVCLLLTACESSGRRAGGESRKNVSPPSATDGPPKPLPSGPVAQVGPYPVGDPGPRALRGEEAIRAIQARQSSGGTVNSLTWEDGKMTVKTKCPDGSSTSIISGGPKGNEIEFRPSN